MATGEFLSTEAVSPPRRRSRDPAPQPEVTKQGLLDEVLSQVVSESESHMQSVKEEHAFFKQWIEGQTKLLTEMQSNLR